MYQQFYDLREPPFESAPDPRFLFLSAMHREALSTLEHGIAERNGIVVLTGEAGTGKTTLIKAVLESIPPPLHRLVHVTDPILTRGGFLELLASGFGLSRLAASSKSKARFLLELAQVITERNHAGGVTALIIDGAQNLPGELFEEVRLLSNIESAGRQLLSVVLAGQPELNGRLEHSDLQRRLGPRCRIGALDIGETAAYVASRIHVAGGEAKQIFSRDAVLAIFEGSHGVPRVVNMICDNALREGLVTNAKPVTRKIVVDVCQRLDLAAPRTHPDVAPAPQDAAAREPEPAPAPPVVPPPVAPPEVAPPGAVAPPAVISEPPAAPVPVPGVPLPAVAAPVAASPPVAPLAPPATTPAPPVPPEAGATPPVTDLGVLTNVWRIGHGIVATIRAWLQRWTPTRPAVLPPEAAPEPPAVTPSPGLEEDEEPTPLLLEVPQPSSWRRVFRRRRDQPQS